MNVTTLGNVLHPNGAYRRSRATGTSRLDDGNVFSNDQRRSAPVTEARRFRNTRLASIQSRESMASPCYIQW